MDWAFFPVNGLGLDLSNFRKEKIVVWISGKKSSEKTEMRVWEFENLEEMSKWTRLFQQMCPA